MLTVLIATYNGAKTLPRVLNAYCQIQAPKGGWKLVIVDNGSTDATKQILHSFLDRLPLTYIFEPVPGKTAALNRGLGSVEGDLVAFTDDDILPRPDWLIEIRRAADSHPSFSIFGGSVVPCWEIAPEEWIVAWVPLAPVFGIMDPSWEEGPIGPNQIFGANLAIRVGIFEAGYRFDTKIGPKGENYAMGSEAQLTVRLDQAGFRAWLCKHAVVEHIIRASQVDRLWILRRAIKLGRGRYRIDVPSEGVKPKLWLGIPRYLIREILTQGLRVAQAKLHGDRAKLFQELWKFNYLRGQAIEARILHKERYSTSPAQVRERPGANGQSC